MKAFIAAVFVAIVAVVYIEACTHNGDCHHGAEDKNCGSGHPVCGTNNTCVCTVPTGGDCNGDADCVCGDKRYPHCIHNKCHCSGHA